MEASPRHRTSQPHLVPLEADHPGFRDPGYRARRERIARIALAHRRGAAVPVAPYTDAEQAVWRTIAGRLVALHRARVATEVLALQEELALLDSPIPQLAELNARIAPATGFRMEPVAGLVAARDFLLALGEGVFLSTQYIRHASRPWYTPEPDVVHELVGHAASLLHPGIAELSRAFGRAARNADERGLRALDRVYWYTLEFGLAREGSSVKAVGAGLLSSVGELAAATSGPELVPLDLDRVARTPYDPTRPQPRLFVAPSLEALVGELGDWLEARRWRGAA